jgi:hypothetical protein
VDIGTAVVEAATGISLKNSLRQHAPTADKNAKYLSNQHRDAQSTAGTASRSTSQKTAVTGAEDSEPIKTNKLFNHHPYFFEFSNVSFISILKKKLETE